MAARSNRTVTTDVHARLRRDIIGGRMSPGERLKFADLQTRYGVSSAAMREALLRLTDQGLVQSQPQVGFTVTPIAPDLLQELTDARVHIECLVFGLAIESGDMRWEAEVVATHHVLDRLPIYVDDRLSEEWNDAHDDFHHALLAGCGNSQLLSIASNLRDAAALYRSWSQSRSVNHGRDVCGEHTELRDCAVNRDVERGRELLAAHIQLTTALLLANGFDAESLKA